MKRLLSLTLAAAMLAAFIAVPSAMATNPVTLTVRQSGAAALTAGAEINVEVLLNPGSRGVASISFLDIAFDSSVLEWRHTGTYNPDNAANRPFTRGAAANDNTLAPNWPLEIWNTRPAGQPYNARFNFDSQATNPSIPAVGGLFGTGGVILNLQFRVRPGTHPATTNVTASFITNTSHAHFRDGAGMQQFGGESIPIAPAGSPNNVTIVNNPIGAPTRSITISNTTGVTPSGQTVSPLAVISGQAVTINAGSHNLRPFVNWTLVSGTLPSGLTLGTNPTLNFNMSTFSGTGTDGNFAIQANWGPEPATGTVTLTGNPVSPASTGVLPVQNGNDNRFIGGATVSLNAGTRPAGWHFTGWSTVTPNITINNASSATAASFQMPAAPVNVAVVANWEQRAGVTVNTDGGTPGASGAGEYATGSTVIVRAGPKAGFTFTHWTVTGGIAASALANQNSPITTFTMPSSAVTLTANWAVNTVPGGFTLPVQMRAIGPDSLEWHTNSGASSTWPKSSTAVPLSGRNAGVQLILFGNTGNWAHNSQAIAVVDISDTRIRVGQAPVPASDHGWPIATSTFVFPGTEFMLVTQNSGTGAVGSATNPLIVVRGSVPANHTQVDSTGQPNGGPNILLATSIDRPTAQVTVNGSHAGNNNTGAGLYAEGRVVGLDAGVHPQGLPFTGWTVTSGSANLAGASNRVTSFTMPTPPAAVTVTANWGTLTTYEATVNGTKLGDFAENANVTFSAGNPPIAGMVFNGWTAVGITAPTTASGSFTMPANNVTLTAIWGRVGAGFGDIDGDGVIDAADITLLRRYIAANDKNSFMAANPRFNLANAYLLGQSTGEPGAADIARLRQFVAGFSVGLGSP